MPSQTFEEILAKIPADQKKEVDQIKTQVGDGLDNKDKMQAAETIGPPPTIPAKTADPTPETGYNIAHLDAQVAAGNQKGNSPTMSKVSDKPAVRETPPSTLDVEDKDR